MLAWASAFVAIGSTGHDYPAEALAFGRMLVATVAVMILLLVRREGFPARAAWPGILVGGLLWFGCTWSCELGRAVGELTNEP